MNREQINHISNRHYKKLQEQCKKVQTRFSIENIHQLRVEYKKLRSFLRMISINNKEGQEIKISKKLRKAYSISGRLRDLQLQRQRIVKTVKGVCEKPQPYLSLLQKEINNLKPGLRAILLANPGTEPRKKISAAVPGKFRVADFKLFIQTKWAFIHSIISAGNFSDDNMHTIRKNLKDIFYNLKLYKTVGDEELLNTAVKDKDEQYFHQLIDELGNFQNSCMALFLLRSYQPKSANKLDREISTLVKKMWLKEKAGIKRLLVKQLKNEIT